MKTKFNVSGHMRPVEFMRKVVVHLALAGMSLAISMSLKGEDVLLERSLFYDLYSAIDA